MLRWKEGGRGPGGGRGGLLCLERRGGGVGGEGEGDGHTDLAVQKGGYNTKVIEILAGFSYFSSHKGGHGHSPPPPRYTPGWGDSPGLFANGH